MDEQRYYYKEIEGNSTLNLKSPLEDATGYEEITEQEFNEIEEQKNQEFFGPNKDVVDEINHLKLQLSQTDYIALKLAEALADDNQSLINQIKTDYATELNNRKVWRARINELEAQLN